MTWLPGDDELDALARSLHPIAPTADRVEHNRTRLLSVGGTVRPRRGSTPWLVGSVFAVAAAAAILVWLAANPDATEIAEREPPHHTIEASALARFDRVSEWPDYVVRVDDGRISVDVPRLGIGEWFRVRTADAELEVRGSRFIVQVDGGRLESVVIERDSIELRRPGQPALEIRAGTTWRRVATAANDRVPPPPPPRPAPVPPLPPPPRPAAPNSVPRSDGEPGRVPAAPAASRIAPSKPAAAIAPIPAPVRPAIIASDASPPQRSNPAGPGEIEFRAGWNALRAGRSADAARLLASACTAAGSNALGEDACFWSGVAAKRDGQNAVARNALTRFVQRFPTSSRAAEASALLGWVLYDAGDLDGAESQFRRAVDDRVPTIRDNARRGLTAIERRRVRP